MDEEIHVFDEPIEHLAERVVAAFPTLDFPPDAIAHLNQLERTGNRVKVWRSQLVERRDGSSIHGVGLFARKNIPGGFVPKGTVIGIKPGHVIDEATVKKLRDTLKGSHQQIDVDRFVAGLTPAEVNENLFGINHSRKGVVQAHVDPDLPIVVYTTTEDILAGQEISAYYPVIMSTYTQRIYECTCGVPDCPGEVDPNLNWNDPKVREAYESTPQFIRDRIDSQVQSECAFTAFIGTAPVVVELAEKLHRMSRLRNILALAALGNLPKALRNADHEVNQFVKAISIFVYSCPMLGNLDAMGIDRRNFQTVIDHVPEIVEFARDYLDSPGIIPVIEGKFSTLDARLEHFSQLLQMAVGKLEIPMEYRTRIFSIDKGWVKTPDSPGLARTELRSHTNVAK